MTKLAYTTRTFQKQDWQASVKLWTSIPGIGLSAADEEARIHQFLDRNPGLSFVALHRSVLVGTIMAGTDGRRGYIYHACVARDFQGQGIGKDLLTACLARLDAAGLDKASLYCKADNPSGREFWTHAGWQQRDDLVLFSWEF